MTEPQNTDKQLFVCIFGPFQLITVTFVTLFSDHSIAKQTKRASPQSNLLKAAYKALSRRVKSHDQCNLQMLNVHVTDFPVSFKHY